MATAVRTRLIKLLPKTISLQTASPQEMSLQVLMQHSLHLGHNSSNWNPHMLPFIYGKRLGINIINLEETMAALRRCCGLVREISAKGGNIVFVGTRPMLHPLVQKVAKDSNSFFITSWVGGLFSNKERVLRRSVGFDPNSATQGLQAQSRSDSNPSDEMNMLVEERSKKQPFVHAPDLLILLDYPNTLWAVVEANKASCPVIAICDTDCDPTRVQYPIPANDDSLSGLTLIAEALSRAIAQGHLVYEQNKDQIQYGVMKTERRAREDRDGGFGGKSDRDFGGYGGRDSGGTGGYGGRGSGGFGGRNERDSGGMNERDSYGGGRKERDEDVSFGGDQQY